MDKLKERALELALEGLSEHAVTQTLFSEFTEAHKKDVFAAVQYVLKGGSAPPTEATHNKRSTRKAMIMLKVNYKKADEEAVTECLTDLQHYCHAKGIDYLTCEERAQQHFIDESEAANG